MPFIPPRERFGCRALGGETMRGGLECPDVVRGSNHDHICREALDEREELRDQGQYSLAERTHCDRALMQGDCHAAGETQW
jgi:hypothetical protein